MSAAPRRFRGLSRHLLLTLQLNFRSRQAVVYGYLVPLLFLVAFGSVFRAETPALLGQIGQLMTITVLGGACFGMPTALVAERERGIWRRYRLLPVPTPWLVASVLLARVLLVLSAVAIQVAAARILYGTPLPVHPLAATAAVLMVTASFLGLGLLVAALADDVPAVQAMGQCLFLPMIMIGGVGVPLVALPTWAQRAAGFMPGRYAVELLQSAYCDSPTSPVSLFGVMALFVIGSAAAVAGSRLLRWDPGSRVTRRSAAWTAAALAAWIAVGAAAAMSGHIDPARPPDIGYEAVTRAQADTVRFDQLPGDDEFVSRLARPFGEGGPPGELGDLARRIARWEPGRVPDPAQATRNLLALAGIADVSEDLHEGEVARMVFDLLRARVGDERLRRILPWIILYPDSGGVVATVPELGFARRYREEVIRQRVGFYAAKLLGRLNGRLHD